ncbi:hypothetical protein JGU66_35185 [Myxococcaceae bacterium JPH2]|nr:hypothetical protein [Myxococcaceae bacterium JPH2]
MTLLRAMATVSAVLALSACGAMPGDENAPLGDDSVVESKAALGSCPGYDSCAAFSPWVDVPGTTTCTEDTSCGYTWVCGSCFAGGAQDELKDNTDPSFIPQCPPGSCPQTVGKPAKYVQQTRYRVCYNPAGQSCTDREYQTGAKVACGC